VSRAPKGEQQKAQLEEITIPVFSTSSSTTDFVLEAYIDCVRASCLVDTGAAVSLISESLWERIKGAGEQLSQTGSSHKLVGVQGVPLQLCGSTRVRLEIDGVQKVFLVDVRVVKSITNDVILGRDFLQENHCQVRLDRKCNRLHFATEKATVNLGHKSLGNTISSVVGESIEVLPPSEMEIMVKMPPTTSSVQKGSQIASLLEKDAHLASVCSVKQTPSADTSEKKEKQLCQTGLDTGDTLSAEEQQQLDVVLLESADLFMEQLDAFGRTDKVKHGIKTENTAAVRYARQIPLLKKSLIEAYSDVRHQLQASQERQKETYNKKVHGKPYQEGDFVWLYNQNNVASDHLLKTNSGRIPIEKGVM
jgi:hypothetical protein